MAPPSEDDSRARAHLVTRRYMQFVHETFSDDFREAWRASRWTPTVVAEAQEIYTADIEYSIEQLARSVNLCRFLKIPFPIIATESGPLPIDLASVTGNGNVFFDLPGQAEESLEWQQNSAMPLLGMLFQHPPFRGLRVSDMQPALAVKYFEERLEWFLFARFNARESNIAQKPGRLFTVNTNTSGLRVHYSPAYFFNANNVFGSPTTPVKAWIQPGIYMFGAVGPGVPLSFDSQSHYQIPPTGTAHLNL